MNRLLTFISLLVMWLLLTWSLDRQEIIAGVVAALLVSVLVCRICDHNYAKALNPLRWFWLIVYALYFLYHCLRANLDVAYRALHPLLPIRPGIVKVKTQLSSSVARTLLANSITLTPGTLTVDMKNEELFIHWINVVTDDPQEHTLLIIKRFEGLLRRVFE